MAVIPKVGEVFRGEDGVISVVLPDTCDPDHEPTEEELHEYAEFIGIDVKEEKHLLWIAREGLQTPLPEEWKACRTGDEEPYYFNFRTGESSWDHPLDDMFRQKVDLERTKANASALISGSKHGSTNMKIRSASLSYSSASSSASSDDADSSAETAANLRRQGHVSRLEKGSGGNAHSINHVSAMTARPVPLTSTVDASSHSFSTQGSRDGALVGEAAGKLGALRTPAPVQRAKLDMSSLLEPGKGGLPSTAIGGGSGRGNSGKGNFAIGSKGKCPEGVRDMEASIRQRVDEENDARRRTMRIQQERQLAEERLRLEAEIRMVSAECEKELNAELQQANESEEQLQLEKSKMDAVLSAKQREYDEARKQVTALGLLLQREEAKLEGEMQRRIAEAKERISGSGDDKCKKAKEAAAAKLEKEKEERRKAHTKRLEEESKQLAANTQSTVGSLKKALEEKRLSAEKQLKAKLSEFSPAPPVSTAGESHPDIKEAQSSLELAVKRATAEAAATTSALRHRYENELEELKSEKKRALSTVKGKVTSKNEPVEDTMQNSTPHPSLEEEEKRLKEALEEKAARYVDETQRLLSFMRSELNGTNSTSLNTTEGDNITLSSGAELAEEQPNYDRTWKQLDEQHARTMDRIRSAHEQTLREKHLFDPRKSLDFAEKLKVLQRKWLAAHPKPKFSVGDSWSAREGTDTYESNSPQVDTKLLQERVDAAVKAATEEARCKHGNQLQAVQELLEKENRKVSEAHRAEKIKEMKALVNQYLEVCLAERSKEIDFSTASVGDPYKSNTTRTGNECHLQTSPQLPEGMVSLEEAQRREEEVHRQLQDRVKALQDATKLSQTELRRQQGLLHTKSLYSCQRPPIVPMPASPSVANDAFHTPRFPLNQKQPQSAFTTPMLNNTLSTIPSMYTTNGSEKPNATPYSFLLDICGGRQQKPVLKSQGGNLDGEHILRNTVEFACSSEQTGHDLEQRFQHARLLLLKKKDELLARRACMERSRTLWLRDMEKCTTTGERSHARLLRQIKVSLEEQARKLNQEVLEVRLAFASLRDSERKFRSAAGREEATNGRETAIMPNSLGGNNMSVNSTTAPLSKSSQHMIELLDGILTKAAKLESHVSPLPDKYKLMGSKSVEGKQHHSHARRSHSTTRHVSRAASAEGKSGGVARWLDEQQLAS
ncbi:hypothetical protein, conserved [Trypanosoma brucei brucei TREU927]|uniref:WW domain-containing protein n=2 Tax=Trypanosoma brucei TaxID=5691 RepID=Q582C1_TRYB2|nr:hypothetical protein, conserved [Trypanosoma brucei brucei TREU927]AAX80448.1 hypothetical protein, conserved [Trypanosoma brucei]AAZ11359.1 hypothetical protein, conserved [Trypanosoma brucei brucei TREU927]